MVAKDAIFSVSSDNILKEFARPDITPTKQLDGQGSLLGHLVLKEDTIYAGTCNQGKPGVLASVRASFDGRLPGVRRRRGGDDSSEKYEGWPCARVFWE